jgi:hypothetical protein
LNRGRGRAGAGTGFGNELVVFHGVRRRRPGQRPETPAGKVSRDGCPGANRLSASASAR